MLQFSLRRIDAAPSLNRNLPFTSTESWLVYKSRPRRNRLIAVSVIELDRRYTINLGLQLVPQNPNFNANWITRGFPVVLRITP